MKTLRKAAARRATRRPPLTLTQRVERLERDYFAQRAPKPVVTKPVVTERFTVTEETVQDNVTGLMWTRKNVGTKRLNWEAAKKACAEAGEGGHDDWRLPTIQELLSIVDYAKSSPAIDKAFECESNWYWTGTPVASSPSGGAWIVSFGYGNSGWGDRDDEFCVRAVRAGQSSGQFGLGLK